MKKHIVLPMDAKESGIKIRPTQGCEIDEVKVVDGFFTVTFKEAKPKLPRSWEEFCDEVPTKESDYYINTDSLVVKQSHRKRDIHIDRNLLPNRETAEAVRALYQLIQLRECYNQGWKPDWSDGGQIKYCICFDGIRNIIKNWFGVSVCSVLYFNTEYLRDQFLENFRDLIEKIKPLYGIKKGGEE